MQKHIRILGGLAVVLASALVAQAVEQSSWGQIKELVNGDPQVAGKAAVPQGKGTVKPFELAVEALQDVNKVTEVTVTTKVIVSGFSAPTLSKHIQLKSFDANGELRWTKNQMNVALAPNGSSSSALFHYTDLGHIQPFHVQEQVQNAQTGNTEVLEAGAIVKLRPDVAIGDLTVPAQVHIGQIVNIVAPVKELNGDLSATTNVVLNVDATERDHANGVSVNPLSSVDVVFAVRFDQAGTYELTVVAQDVVPGDYDNSNNANSTTIQVTSQANAESVPYQMNYYHVDQDYDYTYNDWYYGYYSGHFTFKGAYEGLGEYLTLPTNALTFPVDKVSIQISADDVPRGTWEATNVEAQWSYDDGCYSNAGVSLDAGDNTWVYLQSYSDCYWGYSYTSAQFQKYHYDYVYSYQYYYYWGSGSGAVHDGGTFLNATNKVDTRFVVEDDGHAYGGNASTGQLNYQPWDDIWNDWYYQGYQRGFQYWGYSSGYTQP